MYGRGNLFLMGNYPSRLAPDFSDDDDDDAPVGAGVGSHAGMAAGGPRETNTKLLEAISTGQIAIVSMEDVDVPDDVSQKGMCIECGDQPYSLFCESCGDHFCDACFLSLHKKGMRQHHSTKRMSAVAASAASSDSVNAESDFAMANVMADDSGAAAPASGVVDVAPTSDPSPAASAMEVDSEAPPAPESSSSAAATAPSVPASEVIAAMPSAAASSSRDKIAFGSLPRRGQPVGEWFVERSRYIPLRLSLEERKKMRLVCAGLDVSEYTDKIDIISYKNKAKRIHAQLREICAILSGLQMADDYQLGQALLRDADFKDNAEFFQDLFEVARRHKLRNPEKMRSAYGKLLHMMQDSQVPEIQELLEFSMIRQVRTGFQLLEEKGGLDMLRDPVITFATEEFVTDGLSRPEINKLIKEQERAIKYLKQKYSNSATGLSPDDIHEVIRSISDNHNFLRYNRNACDAMLKHLEHYWKPDSFEEGFSLGIAYGKGGSRLTHSHSMQYQFVQQSLTLWREILHDLYRLWWLAEEDFLDGSNHYRLRNTGQGMNRVQACPRVGKAMFNILRNVQSSIGSWVGSSVIHLGDHAMPNALSFVDKYNRVQQILNPILSTLKFIDKMNETPHLKLFVESTYGGTERAKKLILCDFFRHAFDGSGADNFYDAGSCIDGRLTSAFQWTTRIEKKPYYSLFCLSGFQSFDGEWSE